MYVIDNQTVIINNETVNHKTICLIEYLKTHIEREKTYLVNGEEVVIRYSDKLNQMINALKAAA
jgi:hypothetical protein